MRHVSRTHRVALSWLFDRVIGPQKIQIKYVDTKNQLADMLTKGNFTRDEWNHLLRLFNIMNFSMFSCSHFLSIKKPNTISKRAQERRTGEELVVANWKPVSLRSRSLSANHSPMLDSRTSYSPGKQGLGRNSVFMRTERSARDRVQNLTTNSHVWHRGDNSFRSTSSERSEREMNQGSSTRRQVRGVQNQLAEVKLDHHNHDLQVSDTRYIEKFFTNVRQKLNRPEGDQMLDQRANVLTWRLFLCQQRWKLWYFLDTTTMRIWLLTGTPISKSSRRCSTSRRSWVWIRSTRFWMFPRLSCNLLLGWDLLCYMTKHSSGEKRRCMSIQTHFFAWEGCMNNRRPRKSGKISFNISRGPTHNIAVSQRDWGNNDWSSNNSWRIWRSNHLHVYVQRHRLDPEGKLSGMLFEFRQGEGFCKKISVGTWSFLGPGEEEKWHGTHYHKPEGQWNTTAGVMVADFKDSGHPVFRASSALDRRFLKKKGGQCTIHFSAEPSDADLLFRTIHSANQLSIYGAIADWCDELIDSANTWSIISQHGEIRSCVENWSLRKWIRWYEHLGRMFKQRGIDCASIKKDLKSYQER